MNTTNPVLATEAYLDDVRIVKLWPPEPNPVCAQMLAILPRVALEREQSPVLGLLSPEDWYQDRQTREYCLILGRAVMRPSGKYYPQETYPMEEVLKLTRAYRRPQQEEEKRQREQQLKLLDQQHRKAAREAQWQQQEEKKRQEEQQKAAAQRASQPRLTLEEVERRVALLEQKTNPTREHQ